MKIFIGIVIVVLSFLFGFFPPDASIENSRYGFVTHFYTIPAKVIGNVPTTILYSIFGFRLCYLGFKKSRELRRQAKQWKNWRF